MPRRRKPADSARRRKPAAAPRAAAVRGRVSVHRDGFGFLARDDGGDDLFLPPSQMHTVMHGDYVSVQHDGYDRRGRPTAVFREVLERRHETVVGRVAARDGGGGAIVPENPRILQTFELRPSDLGRARDGDLAVAEITRFPEGRAPGRARVARVLGRADSPQMDVELAIAAFDLPHRWTRALRRELAELDRLPDDADRRDLTGLPFVTIDGAGARDFDDAVCARRRRLGGWTLWVAIADVAHYVRPGSRLDAEARRRGTSVYFPDRVVPMLPPELSEDRCSLLPDAERRVLACELALGPHGARRGAKFYAAHIRSRARLTYAEVDRAVFQNHAETRRQLREVLPALEELRGLYRRLLALRHRRGALEFDTPELRFRFDGPRLAGIEAVRRLEAHRLIEECMLAANAAAADHLHRRGAPFLYRVHDRPPPAKLATLRALLAAVGAPFPARDPVTPADCAEAAAHAAGSEHQALVERALLRAQSLSVYAADNIGHFGLALDRYTHFTSPIRRYPDLLAHRALRGGAAGSRRELDALGEHCSMSERRADEAVWDVEAAYKCRLVEPHVGKTWDGTVSAVMQFGLFVELDDLHAEGLIRIRQLGREYFHYDPDAQCLQGEDSGETWRIGQRARVVIHEVDRRERRISLRPRRRG